MVSSPFAAPGPRERQRLETRARLFRAAIDEFRRAGFSGASVARIAEKAGVSRPSFYFHFPTREHVLLELQWNLEQQIVERFERCSSLAECLEVLAVSHAEHFEWIGNREVSREMLRIYARPPEELPVPLDSQPFPVFVELGRRFAEAAQAAASALAITRCPPWEKGGWDVATVMRATTSGPDLRGRCPTANPRLGPVHAG